MHIVIVTGNSNSSGSKAISQQLEMRGLEVSLVSYRDVNAASIINTSDVCFFRISPASIVLYNDILLNLNDLHSYHLGAMLVAFNKAKSAKLLQSHGINIPSTVTMTASELKTQNSYPYVLKIIQGNQGKGVYLVENFHMLMEALKNHPGETNYIFQEFIAESKGTDKRLFVVGDQVIAGMKRTAPRGEFLSNLHAGGKGAAYEPTEQESQLAVRAVKAHGLLYAGVDILGGSRGPLVIEVNPSPGFAIEAVTDINVVEQLVSSVLETYGTTN